MVETVCLQNNFDSMELPKENFPIMSHSWVQIAVGSCFTASEKMDSNENAAGLNENIFKILLKSKKMNPCNGRETFLI
eukprot:UN14697